MSRPTVGVVPAWARIENDPEDDLKVMCTECGDLTDPGEPRHLAQRLAYEHAWSEHDGDVDRAGWV